MLKSMKKTDLEEIMITSSSRWDIGTSVVLLRVGRPRPEAGPDMVMDLIGSGGGLFPPLLETSELKKN